MHTDSTPRQIGRTLLFADGRTLPVISGGDGPVTTLLPTIENLRAEVAKLDEERDAIIAAAETRLEATQKEARDAGKSDDEVKGLRATVTPVEEARLKAIAGELREMNERLTQLSDDEIKALRAAGRLVDLGLAERGGGIRVKREPMTYQRGDRSKSYFRDLAMGMVRNDNEARERLAQHRREMDVELPKIEARMNDDFGAFASDPEMRDQRTGSAPSREMRDITRTDGTGGEFVPPLWLMEEWIGVARAGRPYADRVRQVPLPSGTDSINIPRIATGGSVNVQAADLGAVTEVDITTNSVAVPVRTLAGQQDVSLQLIEQSPLMFDEIIFADLTADYNARLDLQCLNGSGVGGQILGALNVVGVNSISYTDGSPTVAELFPKGADALNQVATNRKLPAEGWHMHPSRWYWMTAALDSNSRPLVVPEANGPYMAQGVFDGPVAEGPAGKWHGLAASIDANMPNTLGAGSNEDRIIGARFSDQILFEGVLRTRALPEVLSGNLAVRLQVYRYVGFTAERYPTGISVISGTGLATPTF